LHDVSAHLQNTFKKTRILQREFWKMLLNAINQNPEFIDIAAFMHFGIVQSMAKNHSTRYKIDFH
jgi:hypothetical protein